MTQESEGPKMNVAVSKDKTFVQLAVGEAKFNLNAALTSLLLHQLMLARVELLPPVDISVPKTASFSARTTHWGIASDDVKGEVILVFPHRGYGWIAYRLPREKTAELAAQLAARAKSTGPKKKGPTH